MKGVKAKQHFAQPVAATTTAQVSIGLSEGPLYGRKMCVSVQTSEGVDFVSQQDNSAGRIIFLNGATCSGKTTIARTLQETLEVPYLHFGADPIIGMLPQRCRDVRNPDNYRAIYKAISGMHHCVATLAAAGNNVIVDTVLTSRDNLAECVFILAHFRVTFVGVFCPLVELERRERERDERYSGMARSHFDQVHAHKIYDVEVDTSIESAQQIAAKIKAYNESTAWPQGFRRIRNEKIDIVPEH